MWSGWTLTLIRLPVGGCLAWQRYGTDWVNLDAPRHLSLFSPLSMQILSERCGLAIAWQHFEGSAASFVSSDLYAKDVPLIDHAARARGGLGTFGLWKAARKYRALAEESNRNGQGDCACFELRLRTEACTPLTAVAITYCAGTGRPRQTALR